MPKVSVLPWQMAALWNPYKHFAMFGGIGVGKTFTGSHVAIWHIINRPDLTGFIGANNHDQMSQATLRELFYWLDHYKIEYVIDRIPPETWTKTRKFKSYKNVLTCRNPRNGKISYAFIRILSDPDALRGIEFSWYWLDESRDTPDDTFKVLLGRLRESDYIKGIITTTTNGEDWCWERFLKNLKRNDTLFGSMHVRTEETVKRGLHSQDWYDALRRSFSPLYAAQELDAEHVNIHGGRAYYSAGAKNKMARAPWGDAVPSRERPLIVGCDFNFSPAPCIWMVGQLGPPVLGPKGEDYSQMIHWFAEIAENEMPSAGMAVCLMQRFPYFFYRVYGDCSGGVGTTSNAGITDYDQIALQFQQAGAQYSIDYFQGDDAQNPRVKNRVENMNTLFCNALGEVRQTYDPNNCPHFDDDVKHVGWKASVNAGRGKLSDGGNNQRTHATDGAGYALYKVFPPASRFQLAPSVPSKIRAESALLDVQPY